MKHSHMRGFTLVETLVYLGIYAIIMSGALVSVYAIFGSSARNQAKAIIQEEGSFLVGKIDWALTGVQSITLPVSPGVGNTLSLTKFDTTLGNPVIIALSGDNFTISRYGNAPEVLNNSNVTITCPAGGCFTHTSASGDGINPESLAAEFTVNSRTSEGIPLSQNFYTIKYLRK